MPMQRLPSLHATLITLTLVILGQPGFTLAQQYDCGQGCPADSSPVCGQDGLTYSNGCLAVCQSVAVAHQGRCGEPQQTQQIPPKASFMDVSSRHSSSSSSSDAGDAGPQQVFSMQDMQQYAQQGYRLLGRSGSKSFDPAKPYLKQQQQQQQGGASTAALGTAAPGSQSVKQPPPTAAVRQSRKGLTYQLSFSSTSATAAAQGTNPTPAASAAMAGHLPLRIPFERAAYDPTAQSQIQANAQGSPEATAALAAADPAAAASGDSVGQSAASPAHELLVQFMQQYGRRKLLHDAWHRTASTARHAWHAMLHPQLPPKHPQPPPPPQQQQQERQRHRSLQYVLGSDDRTEVRGDPTNAWPYSAVGQFLYAKGSCTGVMVGPGAVLTAAHCVYSRQLNMWQQEMVFVPHRHRKGNGVVEPYGRIPVEHITTYSGWTDNSNATDALSYDLAVVKLADSSIGYKTGWLGVAWDRKPYKGRIISAGYPGDKARGSLWVSTCAVTDFGGADARFLTSCDSWNGQSGSPMWEHRKRSDMFYIRAVMSYEVCSCITADCSVCTDHTNAGCKITKMHYRNILKWR